MSNPVETVGVDAVLELDGDIVAAQTDATLTIPTELREIITKEEDNFVRHLSGKQEWSISQDVFFLDDEDDVFIGNQKVELRIDDGTDTDTFEAFPRLTDITLTLTQNLAEVSSLDRELWRFLRPAERLWIIEAEGNWYDPKDNNLEQVLDAKDDRERLTIELDFGPYTFEGEVAVGDFEVSGETGGESAATSFTFGGDKELGYTGPSGGASGDLLDIWFDQAEPDVVFQFQGNDIWFVGSAFAGELSISVTEGEEPVTSMSLEGNGPIEREDQSA